MSFAVIQNIGGGAYEVRVRNVKTLAEALDKCKHLRDVVDAGYNSVLTITTDDRLQGLHRRGREGRWYAYANGAQNRYNFD